MTRAFLAMLDGLLLQRIEAGAAYRPADLRRRAGAMLELVLAAAGAPPRRRRTPPSAPGATAVPEATATA